MSPPKWFSAAATTSCPPHLVDYDWRRDRCVRCGKVVKPMTILAKPSFLEAALSAQREVEQQAIERCRVAEVERDAYAGKLHRLQARPAEARVAALEAEHTRLKADVNFHTERQAHWETVA